MKTVERLFHKTRPVFIALLLVSALLLALEAVEGTSWIPVPVLVLLAAVNLLGAWAFTRQWGDT